MVYLAQIDLTPTEVAGGAALLFAIVVLLRDVVRVIGRRTDSSLVELAQQALNVYNVLNDTLKEQGEVNREQSSVLRQIGDELKAFSQQNSASFASVIAASKVDHELTRQAISALFDHSLSNITKITDEVKEKMDNIATETQSRRIIELLVAAQGELRLIRTDIAELKRLNESRIQTLEQRVTTAETRVEEAVNIHNNNPLPAPPETPESPDTKVNTTGDTNE